MIVATPRRLSVERHNSSNASNSTKDSQVNQISKGRLDENQKAENQSNDTSNTYDLTVAGCCTGTYSLDLKIENIRVLPGDYSVKVSQHLISEWTNTDVDLTYYIALEPK